MKSGISLQDMATEVRRQFESKKDYIADTRNVEMSREGNSLSLSLDDGDKDFGLTGHCHRQVANRLQIPQKYYDRMREESPILLSANVNHWLRSNPETRMIRTLDGNARAFLSDRYRPLDNWDMANAVLPKIQSSDCQIESIGLTETRLYLKAVTPRITADIKKGDPVQAGIVISNSEVGSGSVRVEPLIFRLVCRNGMIAIDHSIRKFHVGRKNGGDDFEYGGEFFRDETRIADDKAFWMKVEDIVSATLSQDTFNSIVQNLRRSTEMRIEGNPVKTVEVAAKQLNLMESEKDCVLNYLISGGDLSQYGLSNAITRASQDVEDYDRATELERVGGRVIELSPTDWRVLSNAS